MRSERILVALKLCALAAIVAATLLSPRPGPATAAGTNSITSPDTAGSVGEWTSLALDAEGNPVVSYYDRANGNLKVLHCGDANCASGNSITSPDTGGVGGDAGAYTSSLALDAEGNPVVSYLDRANGNLKVLHCGDANCASGNSITSPDTVGDVGWQSSLALDAGGNPVVSYHDNTDHNLKILHCGDANCASGNSLVSPDTGGAVGYFTSLALDAKGNPVVSYFDATNDDLKVMHCGDANCTSGNSITSPDTDGYVGRWTSLALDADGNPVVSYLHDTGFHFDLRVVHCGDANCSAGNTIVSPGNGGNVGLYTSLALDASGYPVVSYYDRTNNDLRLLHCGGATCTSGNTITSPDTTGDVGQHTSLVLDSSGNPLVSYYDNTNGDLKVLHCGDANCTTPFSPTDFDGDGCTDAVEAAPKSQAAQGGGRDPKNPWDFYDTNGDRVVDLFNDIVGVILRFGLGVGDGGYDPAFDRGPSTGPNEWNMTAPDGIIDLFNDIVGVIQQAGHDCS